MVVQKILLVLILTAALVKAQRFGWGPCPSQSAQSNFQFNAYYGRWFEQLRYYNEYQVGTKCETRDYWPRGDGYINVLQNRFNMANTENNIAGTLASSDSYTEGKFDERFPLLGNIAMRYWVIETDYANYSIDWSCREVIPFVLNRQYLWVFTRLRSPTEEYISEMRRRIGERGLDTGPLERMIQECPNFHPPS